MGGSTLGRRTLKRAIEFAGVGLHSGKHVRIRVAPPSSLVLSPPSSSPSSSSGIVFRHPDSGDRLPIYANAEALDPSKSLLCTQLRALDDSWRISTVEHLMAALVAARVSHATVDLVDCDHADQVVEMPILDGSALPFVEAIQQAGIDDSCTTDPPLTYLRVKRPVQVLMQDKAAWFLPIPDRIPGTIPPTLHVAVQVNYHHKGLGSRHFQFTLSGDADANLAAFKEQIAPARTFTFEDEIAWMQTNKLALGGSLENAIVFKNHQDPSTAIQVLNPDGLRFPDDEWVRHKLLDCIGDLGLVGMPVHGHLVSTSPGHALTHRVIQELLSDPANYDIVD